MRKTFPPLLLFLLAFVGLKASPSLDEILARHISAMGGLKKWRSIQSMRMVNVDEGGRRSTLLILKPDACQIIFDTPYNKRNIKSWDGENGWLLHKDKMEALRPGEAIEMEEEVDFHAELMTAKEKGYVLRLKENTKLEGRTMYVIELEKSADDIQTYWVDSYSYLIAAMGEFSQDPKWEGVYFQTFFKNYRPVSSFQFPHRWGLKRGKEETYWFDMVSADINPPLLKGLFSLPDSNAVVDVKTLVTAMHQEASRSSLMEFTFVQKTIRDGAEGKQDTATWYEAIRYPDRLRIDVGEPSNRRAVIYRNDSAYFFNGDKPVRATDDRMEFLLLEGGLKCYALETVFAKMKEMGYDLGKFHEDEYQGKAVYVLGAESGDLKSKQIWVEKNRLIPIRRLDPQPDGKLMEVVYGGFQRLEGKWVETTVDFYLDGELLQRELYSELNAFPKLDSGFFEPSQFGKWHWRE